MGFPKYREDDQDRWEENNSSKVEKNNLNQPETFICCYCGNKQYKSTKELHIHISVSHPVERPVICINSKTVTSEEIIRTTIQVIELFNVQKIMVSKDGSNYQEWTSEELKVNLSNNSHYSIKLINKDLLDKRPVEVTYIFNIKIPDESEIKEVDNNFTNMLIIDNVKMRDVRHFSDACSKYQSAIEYASALADYIVGIMIKDQNPNSGVVLPLAKYPEKLQKALIVLNNFNSPISKIICALIKFNINDFAKQPIPCGIGLLDSINSFFHDIISAKDILVSCDGEQSEKIKYLIDRDSFYIFTLFEKIAKEKTKKNILIEKEELSKILTTSRSGYDQTKIYVLIVFIADILNDNNFKEKILKDLINDQMFGRWAESQLRSLNTNFNADHD